MVKKTSKRSAMTPALLAALGGTVLLGIVGCILYFVFPTSDSTPTTTNTPFNTVNPPHSQLHPAASLPTLLLSNRPVVMAVSVAAVVVLIAIAAVIVYFVVKAQEEQQQAVADQEIQKEKEEQKKSMIWKIGGGILTLIVVVGVVIMALKCKSDGKGPKDPKDPNPNAPKVKEPPKPIEPNAKQVFGQVLQLRKQVFEQVRGIDFSVLQKLGKMTPNDIVNGVPLCIDEDESVASNNIVMLARIFYTRMKLFNVNDMAALIVDTDGSLRVERLDKKWVDSMADDTVMRQNLPELLVIRNIYSDILQSFMC